MLNSTSSSLFFNSCCIPTPSCHSAQPYPTPCSPPSSFSVPFSLPPLLSPFPPLLSPPSSLLQLVLHSNPFLSHNFTLLPAPFSLPPLSLPSLSLIFLSAPSFYFLSPLPPPSSPHCSTHPPSPPTCPSSLFCCSLFQPGHLPWLCIM